MTMISFDADLDDHGKLYEAMCGCGHKMSYHANTMNGMDDWQYYNVLQCCFCECKEFERSNEAE